MFYTLLKRNKRYHELYRELCTFIYFSRLFSSKKKKQKKVTAAESAFRLNVADFVYAGWP